MLVLIFFFSRMNNMKRRQAYKKKIILSESMTESHIFSFWIWIKCSSCPKGQTLSYLFLETGLLYRWCSCKWIVFYVVSRNWNEETWHDYKEQRNTYCSSLSLFLLSKRLDSLDNLLSTTRKCRECEVVTLYHCFGAENKRMPRHVCLTNSTDKQEDNTDYKEMTLMKRKWVSLFSSFLHLLLSECPSILVLHSCLGCFVDTQETLIHSRSNITLEKVRKERGKPRWTRKRKTSSPETRKRMTKEYEKHDKNKTKNTMLFLLWFLLFVNKGWGWKRVLERDRETSTDGSAKHAKQMRRKEDGEAETMKEWQSEVAPTKMREEIKSLSSLKNNPCPLSDKPQDNERETEGKRKEQRSLSLSSSEETINAWGALTLFLMHFFYW